MLIRFNSILPAVQKGQNVVVKVPDVDRGRTTPRNVLAVVTNVNETSLYESGTKKWYFREIVLSK